ncbi:hypothetical protein BDQ17DRAFT_1327490 [Cyathus striatus]|nr:hypothetical protein BDQ17DRAFT_1327490 [Cyathus striatus]
MRPCKDVSHAITTVTASAFDIVSIVDDDVLTSPPFLCSSSFTLPQPPRSPDPPPLEASGQRRHVPTYSDVKLKTSPSPYLPCDLTSLVVGNDNDMALAISPSLVFVATSRCHPPPLVRLSPTPSSRCRWHVIYYKLKFYKDGANIEQKSESTGLMVSKPSGFSSKLLDSSESPEDIAKAMIISHFNIPERLFKKSSKEQDIRATYEKYEIIENIWNNHQPDLSAIGAASKSKVDKKQIISLLIAPSTYYSYASNVFPLLHYYPEMMSWMKREEDIDTNKVWKSKKANFINLLSILEGKRDAIENESQRREVESEEDPESEEEVVKKNKGKGKQREDKGNKGKKQKILDFKMNILYLLMAE